jgi:hypothetical protein
MPRSRVTSGFFRIQMLVVLGLSVLAALTLGRFTGRSGAAALGWIPLGLCLAAGAAAFLGSVLWTLERRAAGTVLAFGIAGLSLAALYWVTREGDAGMTTAWFRPAAELSSALLLGSAVTGMLLGHWYLTAPTMSIAPLHNVTVLYGMAAVLRLAACAVGTALAWSRLNGTTHAVWLSLRIIAGVLGPLATAAMTLRILRFRNTQAATGVLFVGVILTFLGEMTAALLYEDVGMPL